MWKRSPLGDVDALYRETRVAVYLRCKALLRDEAEARDVTQEVYLYVLDHPDEFRGDASPATYLYAIATNRALSRIRARVVRGKESWRESVAEVLRSTAPTGDPEALASAREILGEVLESADDVTAQILVHHFVDGLAQGEIADLMKLSRVTVNQRIQRFREQTRDTVENGE